MLTGRKYNIGVSLLIVLAICMLTPFSFAGIKSGPPEDLSPDPAVSSQPAVQPLHTDRTVRFSFGQNRSGRAASDFSILLRKLRVILDDDWLSKIISLHNVSGFADYSCRSCARFPVLFSLLAASPGFPSTFSGLSPPSF